MKKEDLITEVLSMLKEVTVYQNGYRNTFDFDPDDVYWYWDGFSPDRKFMEEMIDWLKKEQKLNPLLETPKGVEVTARTGEKNELLFIINHNFVPTTISLDGNYKDIVQDRLLHGEIIIAPQNSLILKKYKE